MIPKIIHYCWLSDDPVPENLQKYMDSWKRILTDYEFIKWDFTRFDKSSSVWVSEAFDNKKYAFACDYIRLYALYNYGGIYMDMDIEVLKSFDSLLNNDYMIAKERPDQKWIEAGCFGVTKGSQFIKQCLEYYKDKHFVNDNGVFEDTPLPRIMAKVYEDYHYEFNLLDWHTFTNKSYETGEVRTIDNSFAIHHFAGSWKEAKVKKAENNAASIRRKVPILGGSIAFLYIKGFKAIEAVKKGGFKELLIRSVRYIKKS